MIEGDIFDELKLKDNEIMKLFYDNDIAFYKKKVGNKSFVLPKTPEEKEDVLCKIVSILNNMVFYKYSDCVAMICDLFDREKKH